MIRPLSAFLDDLGLPTHRSVAQHWLDLRAAGGGQLPTLKAIDVLRFPAALPDIWVVAADVDGGFRFHLTGQNVVDWYGSSPKGLRMEQVYPPAVLPLITRLTQRIAGEPAVCYQKAESLTRHWNVPIPMERIGLPLADEAGRVSHILGITTFLNRHGHGSGPQASSVDQEYWYSLA